jgi:hypothetical protein
MAAISSFQALGDESDTTLLIIEADIAASHPSRVFFNAQRSQRGLIPESVIP